MQKYEHTSSPMYFLFMAGYQNLHTSIFFFLVIWSYLQTEISVTLSTGNKLHSSPSSFIFFSFLWKRFVDESAKFIHGTPSPAKPVYYNSKVEEMVRKQL